MFLMPENKTIKWIADKKVIVSGKTMVINFYEYIIDTYTLEQRKKRV